jgi:hypothetical protein
VLVIKVGSGAHEVVKDLCNIYTRSTDISKRPKDPTCCKDPMGMDEHQGSSLEISPD